MQLPPYGKIKKNTLRKTMEALADQRKRNALELILTTISILVFGTFAIRPTLITIASLNRDIEAQQKILVQLEEKVYRLGVVQKELDSNANKLVLIDQAIPPEGDLAEILDQIGSIASDTNVQIVKLSLSKYNPQEKATMESKSGPQNKKQTLPWGEIVLNIQIDGEYNKLREFWGRFENLRRVIITDIVTFKTDEDNNNLLNMTATGKILFIPLNPNEK